MKTTNAFSGAKFKRTVTDIVVHVFLAILSFI